VETFHPPTRTYRMVVWLGVTTGLVALEKLGQAGLENLTDKLSRNVCKKLQFFAT